MPTKKNYWILADSGRFKKNLANSDQEMIKNKNRLFHFYVFQHCRVVHRNWANTLVISDIYHSKTLYWYTKANSRLESQVAHQILENRTILHYSDLKKRNILMKIKRNDSFEYFSYFFLKNAWKFDKISHLIWRLVSKFQIKREILSKFCALLKNWTY